MLTFFLNSCVGADYVLSRYDVRPELLLGNDAPPNPIRRLAEITRFQNHLHAPHIVRETGEKSLPAPPKLLLAV